MQIKNKSFFIVGIFMLCIGLQFFNYGGSTAVSPFMTALGAYQYYSLATSLGSAGSMIALPAVGAISNRLGRRNIIAFGAAIMLISRTAIQFTNHAVTFMVWQTMGSFGAGLLMSIPYSLISVLFEQKKAVRYYGFIATFNALGALFGPVIAGVFIDAGLIRISFLIWIPLVLLSLIIFYVTYPNQKSESEYKFDVAGLGYLAAFVIPLVLWLGLSGKLFPWVGPGIILLVIAGVAAILLKHHSAKVENPTVPLHVFRYRNFRTAFAVNFLLVPFSTCSAGYVLVYILYSMGKSTTIASTGAMPNTILVMVCGLFMGRILARNFVRNVRTMMIVSSLCMATALLCFCLLQPESPMTQVWIASAFGGIGNSIAQTCLTPFMQWDLPKHEYVAAQGMYQFSSTCGSSIFGAIAGVLIGLSGGNTKYAFYFAFALALVNVVLVCTSVKITKNQKDSRSRFSDFFIWRIFYGKNEYK